MKLGRGHSAMTPPRWVGELLDRIFEACVNDVKGRMSGFSYRWAKPAENHWGTWLIQIAPSLVEMSGGKDDGAAIFDFMDVDLLALPKCLDEVESFSHDPDYGQEPRLTLVGRKGKRDVVVEIYFQPFPDDEPLEVFDFNSGAWRDKQSKSE
jgi:hypothetical protein